MPFQNLILRELDEDACRRLSLTRIKLPSRKELQGPNTPIHMLYFIESGLGSMTTSFSNGMQVEVGTFGFESVVGIGALLGARRSLNRVFMQIGGSGYATTLARGKREFMHNPVFRDMVLHCVQVHLTQATQSAACNAVHTHERRLARWLLLCADRTQQTHFRISQEFLADMLGSTRSTVSLSMKALEQRGLMEHRRNSITIPDLEALENASCECYRVVQRQFHQEAQSAGFTL